MQTNTVNANGTKLNKLSVFILGFDLKEHRLIDAMVKLSQRKKNPEIQRLDVVSAHLADVVIIDDKFISDIREKIEQSPWITDKTVIRVDAKGYSASDSTGSVSYLKRPVQWTNLPRFISKAHERSLNNQKTQPENETLAKAKKDINARIYNSKLSLMAKNNESALMNVIDDASLQERVRILVVDDSSTVRNHLRALLEEKNIVVDTAATGKKGIELYQTENYECVLLDVLMPDMDGYETCRALKAVKSKPHTPVIMLTSKSSPFDKIRGKLAGCDAYLTKPTTLKLLFNTLGKFITITS